MYETGQIEELRRRLEAAEELNAQLEHALQSRIVIEQAKGILGERLGVGVEEAFEILRYAARTARMKLHVLAEKVVREERTPNPVVVALARRSRWRAALMRERAEASREVLGEIAALMAANLEGLTSPQRPRASGPRPIGLSD